MKDRIPKGAFMIMLSLMILIPLCANGKEEEKTVPSEPLEVSFWTAPNQGQFDFWNEKADRFNNEKNMLDGRVIQIKLQMMPETPSSEAGIQNALATNTAPAASTNINRGFAATLAASGRVFDLKQDSYFKEIVNARHIEGVLPGWEINGGQYVIPLYANAMGYHWNSKALNALGFTQKVPETVEDIEELISRFRDLEDTTMKEMGVSHLFMRPQLMHPEWWWDRWFDFQMQYEAFSGGKNWVTGNKLTLDKAITVEVMDFYGSFGPSLQTAEDWTAFEQESVPVVFQVAAPWDIPKYDAAGKEYGLDKDYIYGPAIVKEKGDTPYTFADSKGIVFYKGGNVTDEEHKGVTEFVKWCFTGEQGSKTDLEWIETTGMLPVRGDLLSNPSFQEIIKSNPAYSYLADVMAYAVPAMAHEKMADIQTVFGEKAVTPYIQDVMRLGSYSPVDSTPYVEAAYEAMKEAGKLE